jgi:hypothetical protein
VAYTWDDALGFQSQHLHLDGRRGRRAGSAARRPSHQSIVPKRCEIAIGPELLLGIAS